MSVLKKRIEDLRKMADIQSTDGNWNYDPYMHGYANGLLLALATIEGRDCEFLNAPDRWLSDSDGAVDAEKCASPIGYVLPDESAFFTASYPLPKNHWIYEGNDEEPPAPFRMGKDVAARLFMEGSIRAAAKYAIRGATVSGKEMDFDPDALIQNLIIGLLGYLTVDGTKSSNFGVTGGYPDAKVGRFEVGGYYRHPGGEEVHIVGEVKTDMYGKCLVGESSIGCDLRPFDTDSSAFENWEEISEEEWNRNFER